MPYEAITITKTKVTCDVCGDTELIEGHPNDIMLSGRRELLFYCGNHYHTAMSRRAALSEIDDYMIPPRGTFSEAALYNHTYWMKKAEGRNVVYDEQFILTMCEIDDRK